VLSPGLPGRGTTPAAGRWLSKDPIGIRGGLSQYEFCASNPVNFTDPLGLCAKESWFKSLWGAYRGFQNDLRDAANGSGVWGVTAGLGAVSVGGAWIQGAGQLFSTGSPAGIVGGVVFTGVGLFIIDCGVSITGGAIDDGE